MGRFRKFASVYSGPPASGAGAHPLIANSGWQTAWNGAVAANSGALVAAVQCDSAYQTYNGSGANDRLPMNCVNWYEAFAFCAWDGGRLPTQTEGEYVAYGGNSGYDYPWGSASRDSAHAVYGCGGDGVTGCAFSDILPVGSKPAGAGKWGQLDLSGSVFEWVLDWDGPRMACNNCANLTPGSTHYIRGGSWSFDVSYLHSLNGYNLYSYTTHYSHIGFRCARSL